MLNFKKILLTGIPILIASSAFISCTSVSEVTKDGSGLVSGGETQSDVANKLMNLVYKGQKSEEQINSIKLEQTTELDWIDHFNEQVELKSKTTDAEKLANINKVMETYINRNWYYILTNLDLITWKFNDVYRFPKNDLLNFTKRHTDSEEATLKNTTILNSTFKASKPNPVSARLISDTEFSRGNYYITVQDTYFLYFSYKQNATSIDTVLEPHLYRFASGKTPSYQTLETAKHNILLHPNSNAYVEQGRTSFENMSVKLGNLLTFEISKIEKRST